MVKKKTPLLYFVIPCYNEEEVLNITSISLKDKCNNLIKKKIIDKDSKILYVNDGSNDSTWAVIERLNAQDTRFTGICLSRNYGHQNALLAGLNYAKEKADIVISMDADMQDDINVVDEMINKYNEGNEIVYGIRSDRSKDSWVKRTTAKFFYKIVNLFGTDIISNHADFRLTSSLILNELDNFKEVNLFLRGIIPLIGFKHDFVYYERSNRVAGKSKYTFKKMFSFAWDGITSFTVKPLRFICALGAIILFVSVLIMFYALFQKISGNTVAGWTFLTISIWFLGGLQMLSIGIIGEYIGKIYSETKARPRFIISKKLD